jgi:DNA transposition AAA+ family ATPase
MTKEAQALAKNLGNIPLNPEKIQAEIERLNKKSIVSLEKVKNLHEWLEGKRQSRQSGRVVGESRTGKTVGCDASSVTTSTQTRTWKTSDCSCALSSNSSRMWSEGII